jgi:hypothetical protein
MRLEADVADVMFERRELQAQGFSGFVTFAELWESWLSLISKEAGVYAVLRESETPPRFLDSSPGGRFKRKDPTVPISTLETKWVRGAHLIYLGKGDNLQRRLKEYARFGRGEPVGHWGGRYIWQLADSEGILVCWKLCGPEVSARALESVLLDAFVAKYGRLPFANINR